jgi:preprotein translocase subunit SecA
MIRFGTDRAKEMLKRVGFDGDASIRNKMLSNSIEAAQKRVEGNNFDIRKQLLQYDDVINQQRLIIYEKRNEILDGESIHENILNTFYNYLDELVNSHLPPEGYLTDLDKQEILESTNEMVRNPIKLVDIAGLNEKEVIEFIYQHFLSEYENKIEDVPSEVVNEFEKAIALRVIDLYWMEHINTMSHLREGIYLRGYAQEDPLRAYTTEGFDLFADLQYIIDKETANYLLKAEIRQNMERKQVAKGEAVSDTNKVKKQAPKKVSK